jgi:hypothetical protein
MYEIPGSEHCPVKMYNAYKSKRAADKPFYLAAATNVNAPDDKQQWFVRGPVGNIHSLDGNRLRLSKLRPRLEIFSMNIVMILTLNDVPVDN